MAGPNTPPVNTALPTLRRGASRAQNLSASTGSWSGNPTEYTYRWQLCDSAGNNCTNIGGEIFSGITLTSGDVGSDPARHRDRENSSGTGSATSAPSAVVAGANTLPVNTGLPTLSGVVEQGENLFASTGSGAAARPDQTYRWRLCDSSGDNCTNIVRGDLQRDHPDRRLPRLDPARHRDRENSSGTGSATSAPTAVVK